MGVESIQIGNTALEFIEKRIADVYYRGAASSEHNRYDMEEIHDIMRILNNYAPNKRLLQIRTTDTSRRPFNYPEEYAYAEFCNEVKSTVKKKKGTQDSLRKNIFPDLHRMGFIARYDSDGNVVAPYEIKKIKYVSLTDLGVHFATETNILNQSFMFSKAVDILLGGYLELVIDILSDTDNGINKLSFYEYMFFVSAVNTNTSFSINRTECIELVHEYRKLSNTQKNGLINALKTRMNPDLYSGNKKDKRDWHNWVNKITQIFYLFNQTAYFDVYDDTLYLRTETKYADDGNKKVTLKRSISAKQDYFKNHKVQKTLGFELHHVIPLSWSENIEQYNLYDNWKNLIYIDAYSHSIITQNNNNYINMSANGSNITLNNTLGNHIELSYNTNIIYDINLQNTMLSYNQQLIETI
ncbi:MAG: hypothetical protein K2F90_02645 [Clostridiales bacterium]|nr:hypothetical protein [Clostridiales bacterium]